MADFSTDFTGAIGTNLEDTDAGWSLIKGTPGDIELNGNGYLQTAVGGRSAGPPEAMVARQPGTGHYIASLTFANSAYSNNVALLVAATADGATGIWLCQDQNRKQIYKVVNGTPTQLANALGAYRENGAFTLEWDGTNITVRDPADTILYGPTAVADVAAAGGTYAGVASWGTSASDQADAWSVENVGGAVEEADLTADLPPLTGSLGAAQANASLTADLPALIGSVSAVTANAALTADLPALTGSLGAAQGNATLTAGLAALTGSLSAAQTSATLTADLPGLVGVFGAGAQAQLSAALPALTGSLSVTQASAALTADLPALAGALTAAVPGVAAMAGSLPAMTGSLTAVAPASAALSASLPAMTAAIVVSAVIDLSPAEAAVSALFDALDGLSGPDVYRAEALPQRVPAGGVVNLVEGDPAEDDPILGVYRRQWVLTVEVQLAVRAATGPARRSALDRLARSVATAVDADPTLGGAVHYAEMDLLQPVQEIAPEGADVYAAAVLPVRLYYESTRNPYEVPT